MSYNWLLGVVKQKKNTYSLPYYLLGSCVKSNKEMVKIFIIAYLVTILNVIVHLAVSVLSLFEEVYQYID